MLPSLTTVVSPMLSTFSALFLPVLVLVSIPLLLSAGFTIALSVLTLGLRVSLVYMELFHALLTNYFCPATPTTDPSLRTVSASRSSPICRLGDRHGQGSHSQRPSRSRSQSRKKSTSFSSGDYDPRTVRRRSLSGSVVSSPSAYSVGNDDTADDRAWLSSTRRMRLHRRSVTTASLMPGTASATGSDVSPL
ncbi:hypothetical protein VTN02DRAFT_5447 [Thermoascus thermophilus]